MRRLAVGAGGVRLPQHIKLTAYPCIEQAGIDLGLYGPAGLAAAAARAGMERWSPPPQRFVSKRLQECNYLQAMEGGIDSSHVSWLHGDELNTDPLFKGSKGNEYNETTACRCSRSRNSPAGC